MTQFSSKPPFNDDPAPWADYWERSAEQWAPGDVYAPRPEYERPQHNPTNPILTEFRRIVRGTGNGLYVTAFLFSGDLLEEPGSYPEEQWHHAMDVLEKILKHYKP